MVTRKSAVTVTTRKLPEPTLFPKYGTYTEHGTLPRFLIFSDKALKQGYAPDAVFIITSVEPRSLNGWKCVFGKEGVFHPSVNRYGTAVPYGKVVDRLGTDNIKGGNKGSEPTFNIKRVDSLYREVTIKELAAMAADMKRRQDLAAQFEPVTRASMAKDRLTKTQVLKLEPGQWIEVTWPTSKTKGNTASLVLEKPESRGGSIAPILCLHKHVDGSLAASVINHTNIVRNLQEPLHCPKPWN